MFPHGVKQHKLPYLHDSKAPLIVTHRLVYSGEIIWYPHFHKSSSIFKWDKVTETTAYRAVRSKGSESTRWPYVPCHLVSYRLIKEPILAAVYEVSDTVCNTCLEIKLDLSSIVKKNSRRIHHDPASAKPDRKIARRREVELTHQQLSNLKKKCAAPFTCAPSLQGTCVVSSTAKG